MFARFQLLAAFVAAMFVASAPAPAEAKITYVKPLWQPVSEWSPPEGARGTLSCTAPP